MKYQPVPPHEIMEGDCYYITHLGVPDKHYSIVAGSTSADSLLLLSQRGLVHRTKEEAVNYADALLAPGIKDVQNMAKSLKIWPDAVAELRRQQARIAELEAARIAYASEFEPDANGDPDVGNIHTNIRALKAQLAACTTLLKKTPKIMQNIYVGKDQQSWGAQAKAVLDAAIAAQAKQGEPKQ